MPSKSVNKALDILDKLAYTEGELSLAEISEALDLPASTAHRLLATLVRRRFVVRNANTRKYSVSLKLADMGATALRRPLVLDAVKPALTNLATQAGETAALVWRYHYRGLYVDQATCAALLHATNELGASVPLHGSALGKVILASFSTKEIERYIELTGLPAYTRFTITNPFALKEHLLEIHEQGYAIDRQEGELGAGSVAAGITDTKGDVSVAIGIIGPVTRLEDKGWDKLTSAVSGAASQVSSALGLNAVQTS